MAYLSVKKGRTIPAKGRGSKLTVKQEAFCLEYMVDGIVKRAAERAGYSKGCVNDAHKFLMNHPGIIKRLDELRAERRERLTVEADYVIDKLVKIVEDTETDNPQAALRGLELLGKHLGLYKEKQEISGPDGAAIKYEQQTAEKVNDFTSKLKRLADNNVVPLKQVK